MKKRQIAICDREREYTCRFTEYANQQKDSLFLIHGFSNCEELLDYTKDHTVDILLLAEEYLEKIPLRGSWEQVFLLTEDPYQKETAYPGILKYQACGAVLRQVMNLYAEQFPDKFGIVCRPEKMKRIGIYSPVGRLGKTGFALALGQMLTKKKKCLYLNLEEYSGFETLYPYGDGGTLSELMYFLKQGKNAFACKLEGIVQQIGGLDYIPPVRSPVELRQIKKADWELLLNALEKESRYELVILDLGGVVDGLYELLEQCDGIYMPVGQDEAARAKISQYETVLKMQEMGEIQEKTIRLQCGELEELECLVQREKKRWLDL